MPETSKQRDPVFAKAQNFIVGNNRISFLVAKEQAISLGYNTIMLTSQIEGEAREVEQGQIRATGCNLVVKRRELGQDD